jgi:hypothetical protein
MLGTAGDATHHAEVSDRELDCEIEAITRTLAEHGQITGCELEQILQSRRSPRAGRIAPDAAAATGRRARRTRARGIRQARRTRPRAAPVRRCLERPECSCPRIVEVKPRRRGSGHDGLSRTLRDLPDGPGDVTRGAGDAGARTRGRTPHQRRRENDQMVMKTRFMTGDAYTICVMAGAAA